MKVVTSPDFVSHLKQVLSLVPIGVINGLYISKLDTLFFVSTQKFSENEKENEIILPHPVEACGIFFKKDHQFSNQHSELFKKDYFSIEVIENQEIETTEFNTAKEKKKLTIEILSKGEIENIFKNELNFYFIPKLKLNFVFPQKTDFLSKFVDHLRDRILFQWVNEEGENKIFSLSEEATFLEFLEKNKNQQKNDKNPKNKKKNSDLRPVINFSGKEKETTEKNYNKFNLLGNFEFKPELSILTKDEIVSEKIEISYIWFDEKNAKFSNTLKNVAEKIENLIRFSLSQLDSAKISPKVYSFKATQFLHPLLSSVPLSQNHSDESLESYRMSQHELFLLPPTRPVFRLNNAFNPDAPLLEKSNRLSNVHLGLPTSLVQGGKQYLVSGTYEYYHYLQDRMNDKGWGCAYRSMQTICSWLRLQGFTQRPDPSILDIQKCLFELGDKPAAFVGSSQWIGAIEICFALQNFYGITSKVLNINSGSELPTLARELQNHFVTQGTPIMIGGGVLAYTILGIDYNEKTGAIKYLILDPHYTGKEDLQVIQDNGWCNWKDTSLFRADAYYNLCLPQCPNFY